MRKLLAAVGALLVLTATLAPAVSGGSAGTISVTASLEGCDGNEIGATCRVGVSYSSLAGASHYTARVTRPDGTTQSFGTVSAGHATLPVSYAGNGYYVVTISAWR